MTPTGALPKNISEFKNVDEAIAAARPKKRLFIGLLLLAATVFSAILFVMWRIGRLGLAEINGHLPAVLGAVGAFVVGVAFLCIINLVLAVENLPSWSAGEKYTYRLINFLFPLSVALGKLFGVKRRQVEGSFVAVSNVLFARRNIRVAAERLLVITPHCLQLASCPHKITRDPNNCKRCGGCNIGDLMKLSDELGFRFLVATGGTLARQMVKEARPKAVLAVACERDLMSGIRDVYPLPAVGVLNIRPNGPCYNTKVDMEEVRRILQSIILPKDDKTGEKNG